MELKKRVHIQGIEYAIVPEELWLKAVERITHWEEMADCKEDETLLTAILTYEQDGLEKVFSNE